MKSGKPAEIDLASGKRLAEFPLGNRTSAAPHAAPRPVFPMTPTERKNLLTHLQTALEIEYSTVPIYLYTYYSIQRQPSNFPKDMPKARQEQIATFANKAGGLIMSVAVEEMLHMSLASNLIRALGGMPDLNLYQKPSTIYPTPLPHHSPKFNPDPQAKGEFKVPLSRLTSLQLGYFLGIEYPETRKSKPQGNNWDTIGQFYHYITDQIEKHATDTDFSHGPQQLGPGRGYYSPNNVDTIYPKDAKILANAPSLPDSTALAAAAVYPDNHDSGGLVTVVDKASALLAINTISEQGEGNPTDPSHRYDDPSKQEDTHWFKFSEVRDELARFSPAELATFVFAFPDNPTRDGYKPAKGAYDYRSFVDLANAVFTYVFQLTQLSFQLSGTAQHMVFNIGMHKAMIFVLDKIVGAMRYYYLNGNGTSGNGSGTALAPTFENYPFKSLATAKQEMVTLFAKAPADFQKDNPQILKRMQDLPDVNVGPDGTVRF